MNRIFPAAPEVSGRSIYAGRPVSLPYKSHRLKSTYYRRAAMAGASPRPTAAAIISGESVNRPYGVRKFKIAALP